MSALLQLSEAQLLYDATHDPVLCAALMKFFKKQRDENVDKLVSAVRSQSRDTMREARIAGKAESYEEAFGDLETFAEEQLKGASQ